jgi:Right handed beta helix region
MIRRGFGGRPRMSARAARLAVILALAACAAGWSARAASAAGGGLSPAERAAAALAKGPFALCVRGDADPSCTDTDLSAALRKIGDGATLTIRPGTYHQAGVLKARNATIRAKGAHLQGVAAEGKAALVLAGGNTTIIGLECSGIRVPHENGACVRVERPGVTLRDVNFHDNQEGILAGQNAGDILIEDSVFQRNGANRGQAHQIYVGGRTLTIRRSRIIAATGEGHEVKSRAKRTVIEDSVIAALDAQDSRAIDFPGGGELIVRNCLIERGPKTENTDLIGFAFEVRGGYDPSKNSLTLTRNTVLIDGNPALWVRGREIGSVTIKDNVVIGPFQNRTPGNTYHGNRASADYPPFPALTKRN